MALALALALALGLGLGLDPNPNPNQGPMLYALVKFIKPGRVLEVGAGYTSLWLLQALRDNPCPIPDPDPDPSPTTTWW